jgi:tRNA(fMet)-specific endonuclease VapC
MKYLLDSNIIILLTMNADAGVVARAAECFEGDLVTSAVAIGEVALGSVRGKPPGFAQLQAFLEEVPVLPFDMAAARAYATLPFKRRSFDRLIAAQALALDVILVTDNEKDFADIPGLKVENWTL